jgi:hypothetical protein
LLVRGYIAELGDSVVLNLSKKIKKNLGNWVN